MFPSKGKQIYKSTGTKTLPENLLHLLGGSKAIRESLKAAIEIGVRQSPKISELELDETELDKAINSTVTRLLTNFAQTNLFFIDSTPIVRYQKGAKDADSVIRNNPSYTGGYSSLYVKKAEDYAEKHEGSVESKLDGQIHHNVPLYLGGSHFYRNLIAAVGSARVDDSLEAAADSAPQGYARLDRKQKRCCSQNKRTNREQPGI